MPAIIAVSTGTSASVAHVWCRLVVAHRQIIAVTTARLPFTPVDVDTPEQTTDSPDGVEEQETQGEQDEPVPTAALTKEDEALFGPEPQEQEAPPEPQPQPQSDPTTTPVAPNISTWGIRLVSTINDTTPPRAVLALTTGEEIVVRAGQMLPEAQMVILAIGQDVVQVANITADGDRALVEAITLNAFSPNRDTRE